MRPFFEGGVGNPNAQHSLGLEARASLDGARGKVARLFGATPAGVIFTASATEANNLAIKGLAQRASGRHLVTSAIEHISLIDSCRELEKRDLGEGHDHAIISQMPDLTNGPARISGPRAFEMAGVTHADLDVVQVYDSFTYTVLLTLEDLGFCAKGEGGAFVSNQRTAPGGDFPLNTSGGGLSYTHPGMFGIFTIIEGVRQLRHDYADQGIRQVKDAKLGLVHGTGGVLSMGCTVGQAITGISTLAIGSILTFLAIVIGAAGTMKYQYWRIEKGA